MAFSSFPLLIHCNQFTAEQRVNSTWNSPVSILHGLPIIFRIEPKLYHGLQGPPWTDSTSRYNHTSYHHPFTIYHLHLLTFCSSNMPSTFLSRIFFFPASLHGTLSHSLSLYDQLRSSHGLGLSTNSMSLERLSLTSPILSLTSPALFPSRQSSLFKIIFLGTFLLVQWLRLYLVRLWIQSLVREPRSHMPHGQKNQKQYCNKFSEDFDSRNSNPGSVTT